MKMSDKTDNVNETVWRQFFGKRRTLACLIVIALYAIVALWGEGVFRYYKTIDKTPPYQTPSLDQRYIAPGFVRAFSGEDENGGGLLECFKHPMGTDNLGRDVMSRLVQGTRIAFHVGIMTALIGIPLGVLLGALGGYFGGKIDAVIVWIYSTIAAVPGVLFILAVAMVVGKGLLGIYLGIGLTTWVSVCRLVRAEVIKHRNRGYVQAAQTLGFGHFRILFRHILPNVIHVVIIAFSIRFPAAVSTEVFLSFLGIGVQNEPSWGVMVNNARLRLWQGVWWEMAFVTVAIFMLVLCFNLLGDDLRDALDPSLRGDTEG